MRDWGTGGFSAYSGIGGRQSRLIRAARDSASRGRVRSASSAPESARVSEPDTTLASDLGKSLSVAPLAHSRLGRLNLFCKLERETEIQRREGPFQGHFFFFFLTERADRRGLEQGFCSPLTTQPLCAGAAAPPSWGLRVCWGTQAAWRALSKPGEC